MHADRNKPWPDCRLYRTRSWKRTGCSVSGMSALSKLCDRGCDACFANDRTELLFQLATPQISKWRAGWQPIQTERWSRFKGDIGDISERRDGAHNYGLFPVHRYHLELNCTELDWQLIKFIIWLISGFLFSLCGFVFVCLFLSFFCTWSSIP